MTSSEWRYGPDTVRCLLHDRSPRELRIWLTAVAAASGRPVDDGLDDRETFTYDDLLLIRVMLRVRSQLAVSHKVAAATAVSVLLQGADRVSLVTGGAAALAVEEIDVGQVRRELDRQLTFNRRCKPISEERN